MTIDQLKEKITSQKQFILENEIWYSPAQDEISYPKEGYIDMFRIEDNSFWFNHRNNCLLPLVKKYAFENIFLDVGGGNGFVTKFLANSDIEAILVEPGKQAVLNAKRRGVKNIFCGLLTSFKGLENMIPTIGCFDVIEHIDKDDEFVSLVNNMLSPNGSFFLTVPAFNFLWSHEDIDAGHYRRYTRREICKLLEDKGFEIIYSTYFFSLLLLPLFILRTLPSRLGLRNKTNKRAEKEHTPNNTIIRNLINIIFKIEIWAIERRKKIPFGTSVLIVAKKK